jgi:3-hexulose-6-phosphate synthase
MKLHISFDQSDLEGALATASEVAPYTQIFEVGTLLMYKYGTEAIKKFSQTFPEHTIVADSKIIDRGTDSVNIFADSGAHWLTIMAGTHKDIIYSACTAAHNQGKKIMLDLLDVSSLNQAALEAANRGVDALRFRQAYEPGPAEFLEHWDMVRGNTKLPIFLVANISRKTVDQISKIKPDGLIIGSAITGAANPREEAQFFSNFCENF